MREFDSTHLVLASLASFAVTAAAAGVDGADPKRTRGEVTRAEERDETLCILSKRKSQKQQTECACLAPLDRRRSWSEMVVERASVGLIASSLCAAQNCPNRRVNHCLACCCRPPRADCVAFSCSGWKWRQAGRRRSSPGHTRNEAALHWWKIRRKRSQICANFND